IDPPAAVAVQLSGVTVFNGATSGSGGGIDVQDVSGQSSTLTLTNCVVSQNPAHPDGGGIDNPDGGGTPIGSQVLGNQAINGSGGAVAVGQGGTGSLTMTDSTIAGNRAFLNGGGLALLDQGGAGGLTIASSTISSNTTGSFPASGVGG